MEALAANTAAPTPPASASSASIRLRRSCPQHSACLARLSSSPMLTAKKKCPGTDRIARDTAVRRSD